MVDEKVKQEEKQYPLQYVKGIGPKRAAALAAEGIVEPIDLLYFFPRDYIDRNTFSSLKALSVSLRQELPFEIRNLPDEMILKKEVTVVGRIKEKKIHTFGRFRKMLRMTITDASNGRAEIIFWNYTDYYESLYKIGDLVSVSGLPDLNKMDEVTFNHPEIDIFDEEDEEIYGSGKILPVYKIPQKLRTAHFTSRQLRKIVSTVLEGELKKVQETLSQELLAKLCLPAIRPTIKALHFPESTEEIKLSRKRMKFEEIFFFELFLALHQSEEKTKETAPVVNPKSKFARSLVDSLKFQLTNDQKKVVREIADDMVSGVPMNRLLQGDVGSGKTIVSVIAILMAIDSGCQTAIMAPTEILAEQHFQTILKMVEPLGIRVIQLVGGQKKKARAEILENIANGKAQLIIGTHAMFESTVVYNNLGLIVIDEQHRFGVAQRSDLRMLAGNSLSNGNLPHMLIMSATPIPRTLSMTLYGDLNVSIIREMPKNRKPIKTRVAFENQIEKAYDFIRSEVNKGHQAYIVYPLVEKSEKLELKAATEHYEFLKAEVFQDLKLGLLHGQMFWYEKDDAMKAFLNREYDILVATTVIEVGIDVPNATVMMINDAHRFGLSQLHQLRGRVGRGETQSFCLLMTKDNYVYEFNKKQELTDNRKSAIIRLKTMEESSDGFYIAEIDMKLRGPGDVLGTKQSGLPDFKFIDLASDGDIIELARKEAFAAIAADPHLRKEENLIIRKEFSRRYKSGKLYFDTA